MNLLKKSTILMALMAGLMLGPSQPHAQSVQELTAATLSPGMALEAPQKTVQARTKQSGYHTTLNKKKPSAASYGAAKGKSKKGAVHYGGKKWAVGGGSLGATSGKASYYWQGSKTASGEKFNPSGISCAHRTLPFGTRLHVRNLNNGKSVVCRVNDRGPFIGGRIVDLSRGAAAQIGMLQAGVVPVAISVTN